MAPHSRLHQRNPRTISLSASHTRVFDEHRQRKSMASEHGFLHAYSPDEHVLLMTTSWNEGLWRLGAASRLSRAFRPSQTVEPALRNTLLTGYPDADCYCAAASSRTTCLPTLPPDSMLTSAAGASSKPSATVSRHLRRPARYHAISSPRA
jgi:hypothetical protein